MSTLEQFTETALAESFRALGAEPIRSAAGIDAFRLPTGGVLPWRAPSTEGREAQLGAGMARVVAEAAQRVAAVDADTSRTDAWKAEQRARIAAETRARFEAIRADAERVVLAFEEADAAEAVPAPLAAGDHAAALIDHEIRGWLRQRSADELAALTRDLGRPEYARLCEAVLRSPVPMPPLFFAAAREAWLARRVAADPQAARLRRQAAERVHWLRGLTEQLASLAAPPIVEPVRRAA